MLVWAGERETDLRISAHFARIGNSVFPETRGTRSVGRGGEGGGGRHLEEVW